jgi:hypothetical protein
MSDAPSIYAKAHRDVASMLGYDLDNLTPEQATRLDVATALRVLLDNQSARLVRGESLDARELLMASEALSRLLPPLREPPPASNAPDPREIMWQNYKRMRDQGAQFGIGYDGLRLENERLKAKIAELEAGGAAALGGVSQSDQKADAMRPADNVVPLREPPKPAPPAPAAAVDLRPSRAVSAGGSAGFRTGPSREAWRNYTRIDWQG